MTSDVQGADAFMFERNDGLTDEQKHTAGMRLKETFPTMWCCTATFHI